MDELLAKVIEMRQDMASEIDQFTKLALQV